MSLVELNFDNVYTPETHVDGVECQLQIHSAEEYHSEKSGKDSIKVVFEDPANDKIEYITIYLGIPNESDDEKKTNKKMNDIKAFYNGFNIDFSGPVDLDNVVGLTANVIVGETNSPEYGKQNNIKSYV